MRGDPQDGRDRHCRKARPGRKRRVRYLDRRAVFRPHAQRFGRHGLFDLTVHAVGDVEVDAHHTVEDTGIVLGEAFCQALGDKAGITRFADAAIAMDETLVMLLLIFRAADRPTASCPCRPSAWAASIPSWRSSSFYAFARDAKLTLHVRELAGGNSHHIIEAAFKAVGRTMRHACELDPRVQGIPSTKGSL